MNLPHTIHKMVNEQNNRVGTIWLNQLQIDQLKRCECWDECASPEIITWLSSSRCQFVGTLFGRQVFSSPRIPPNHILMLPDGTDVLVQRACKLLDPK